MFNPNFDKVCTLKGSPAPALKVQGSLGAPVTKCCHQQLHCLINICIKVEACAVVGAGVSRLLEHVDVEVEGAAVGRGVWQVWRVWRAWQEVLTGVPLACLSHGMKGSVCYAPYSKITARLGSGDSEYVCVWGECCAFPGVGKHTSILVVSCIAIATTSAFSSGVAKAASAAEPITFLLVSRTWP